MNELDEQNDELSAVRALRADAPLPDSDRLAPARARLSAAFQKEARPSTAATAPRPRRRLVLAAVAATAALAVTGSLIAVLSDDGTPAASTAERRTGPQVLSAQASAATLELAAATVEKTGTPEPGPKQWVYEKSTVLGENGSSSEQWTRWDGTGSARLPGIPGTGSIKDFDPNELQVWYGPNQEEKWKEEGYDDRSQRQFYRFLKTLPSDPDRMMKAIRKEHAIGDIEGETAAQRDWREIDVLYRSVLIPPNAQAGLFRALAKISGARVETGIEDPIGRPAIGVKVYYGEPTPSGFQGKQEIFFDPETYTYLGESLTAAPFDRPGVDDPPEAPEDRVMTVVRDAWGVVDKPGERP